MVHVHVMVVIHKMRIHFYLVLSTISISSILIWPSQRHGCNTQDAHTLLFSAYYNLNIWPSQKSCIVEDINGIIMRFKIQKLFEYTKK